MSKNITILGAGESGVGAALLAKKHGYMVFVSDSGSINPSRKSLLENAEIAFEEGGHDEKRILAADEIIKSPGIPFSAAIVQKAIAKDIPIIDELEFASRYTNAKIIAITGTNGKTTTTLLTYHLLKENGLDACLAGNVGHSLAAQLVERDFDWIVCETSSFQIDGMKAFKPFVAIITNITPDHLDRYAYDEMKYAASKFNLLNSMDEAGHFIYCRGSELLEAQLKISKFEAQAHEIAAHADISISNNQISWKQDKYSIALNELPIKGEHNAMNSAAAIQAAKLCGLNWTQIHAALPSFKNASHRLEHVLDIGGVSFINDSKATNVDAVYYALGAFQQPIVWIAGGVDKGNDYSFLEPLLLRVKALVGMGKDNKKLLDFFESKIDRTADCHSLTDAVEAAFKMAVSGDVVLLSPACASFDLFKNYEDRGEQFKTAVQALAQNIEKTKAI